MAFALIFPNLIDQVHEGQGFVGVLAGCGYFRSTPPGGFQGGVAYPASIT